MADPPSTSSPRRTGSHPALDPEVARAVLRPGASGPPPPPCLSDAEDFEAWLAQFHRHGVDTRRIAETSLEAALRIERTIGEEPQPAQGIEGRGLLKVLSASIRRTEDADRRRSDLRLVLGAIGGTLALIGTIVGVLKGLGWLH